MLSKHKVDTPMSSLVSVKRGFGLLAFLLLGLAADAYAQSTNVPPFAHRGTPEIAVGAGISAFVLAGGGLLLLADRLRRKKNKSKS